MFHMCREYRPCSLTLLSHICYHNNGYYPPTDTENTTYDRPDEEIDVEAEFDDDAGAKV